MKRPGAAVTIGALSAAPLIPCTGVPSSVVEGLALGFVFVASTVAAFYVAKLAVATGGRQPGRRREREQRANEINSYTAHRPLTAGLGASSAVSVAVAPVEARAQRGKENPLTAGSRG